MQVQHQAVLVQAAVERHAILFLFRIAQAAEHLAPAAEHRNQAPEVDHPAVIGVVEKVAGLVERADVERRTVDVDDHDPFEPLLAKLGGEVHVHRAQRARAARHTYPGNTNCPPSSFDPLAPAGICGNTSAVHPGLLATAARASSSVSRSLRIPSVYAGRYGPCSSSMPPGRKTTVFVAIEGANLGGVQIGEAHDLGAGARASGSHEQERKTQSTSNHTRVTSNQR